MARLPPLPPGASMVSRPPMQRPRDPLAILKSEGFEWTSGYRTPVDTQRIRDQGYAPADNSLHLEADAVDLKHPKLSPAQQERRLKQLFGGWEGAKVIDEGHHRHLQLPGWGRAPGTPGTAASGLPPLPEGATLYQRGSLAGDELPAEAPLPDPDGSPWSAQMSPKDAKALASQVPESTIEAARIRAIMHPDNFAAAPAGLITEPPMTTAEELANINRITHPNQPAPLEKPRIGIGPTINKVRAKITGEQLPQEVDTTQSIGGFFDELPEETRRKLTTEQIEQYVALARTAPKAEEIEALFRGFGWDIHNAKKIEEAIARGGSVNRAIDYRLPVPKQNEDGTTGAALRGFGDPVNFLDEMGGVVDTLGGTEGRESVWDSERSFGDILDSNIDLNRGILAADERDHPYARLGGQLASGLVLPYGGGVRSVSGLAKLGAIEGAAAGLGAGEGNVLDRAPNAAVGAGLGAAGGATIGKAFDLGGRAIRRLRGTFNGQPITDDVGDAIARQAEFDAAPVGDDRLRNQPQGDVMAVRMSDDAGRQPDRIDVSQLPSLPPGATLLDEPVTSPTRMASAAMRMEDESPSISGRPAPTGADPANMLRVEDASRLADVDEAAQRIAPEDVLPLSEIAPDERAGLTTRQFDSSGRPVHQRGPVDLVGFVRSMGGVKDEGGELSHLGITNAPRVMDFAKGEGFLGGLVRDDGRSLDEMAEAATEAGYFRERPTIPEFLDALGETHSGAGRRFLNDDLGEVARHEAEREQRLAMGAADQDLADIRKVANVRLDKIETPMDVRRALTSIQEAIGDNPSLKRVSHEETAELAEQLGMTPEQLMRRRQGQALNHAEAYAARILHASALEDTVARARKALTGSDEDKAAFLRSIAQTAALHDHITGAAAEAGRALSQYRMIGKATARSSEAIKNMIEGKGGHRSINDMAEALIDLEKVPGAANRFIQNVAKPTWKDKAVELWYNSLLSGPRTHAVNILSNAMTSALQIPEHATAAMIGLARRRAQTGTDRVLMSELGPRMVGLLQGAAEGLKAFKYTLRTGKVPDHVTKVEAAQQEAISGVKGKILRTPTRLLSAEDEFFKAVARRSELAALAVRKARSEGLKGEALTSRIDELTANPTDEMVNRSLDYARYLTFQRPLGAFGQDVMRWTSRSPILKLFLPFVRTPTNLLKFALERSPAAPVLREVRDDFKAGGAKRDLAAARMTLGTGLGMLVTQWAGEGAITGGGPADQNRERLLRADGWQPYSIKVGDKYVSYQRLDPLATTLGVASDLVDLQSAMTDKQQEQVASLVAASVIQNLANKTWLSGASDLAEAVGDPQRYGPAYARRLAGSLTTPAASSQLAQTIDPNLREARTILDAVRARVPGASKFLLPQRDAWGEEIVREGGVGPDILSPLPVSTRRNDPVTQEAIAAGAVIGKPQRKDMSDKEYNEFVRISGQLHKQAMAERIRSPDWKSMTVDERRKAFDKTKLAARKAAKETLFGDGKGEATTPVLPPLPPGAQLVQ